MTETADQVQYPDKHEIRTWSRSGHDQGGWVNLTARTDRRVHHPVPLRHCASYAAHPARRLPGDLVRCYNKTFEMCTWIYLEILHFKWSMGIQ